MTHFVLAGDRAQRPQHLDLLVAHRVRIEIGRRLHGHQAQQLQHMVLHHVAQGAVIVVIAPAALHPHRLADGDLHVLDGDLVPQRLEQGVGEAQGQEVLDRLLAQIVVDAEDLALAESAAEGVVDHLAGGQVAADRLFHDHPAARLDQTGFAQMGADGVIEAGRGGQIEDGLAGAAEQVGEILEGLRLLGVEGMVVEPRAELGPGFVGEVAAGAQLDRRFHVGDEGLMGQGGARRAENPEPVREFTLAVEEIERRKQHTLGQIAGRADDHDGLGGHLVWSSRALSRARCVLYPASPREETDSVIQIGMFSPPEGRSDPPR